MAKLLKVSYSLRNVSIAVMALKDLAIVRVVESEPSVQFITADFNDNCTRVLDFTLDDSHDTSVIIKKLRWFGFNAMITEIDDGRTSGIPSIVPGRDESGHGLR